MKWYQWWALEIMAGLGILVATLPLGYLRFLINAAMVTVFAVCYHHRVNTQTMTKISRAWQEHKDHVNLFPKEKK